MSVRVMIIDGYADFRSLLMHHVTTLWPDAVISTFDPVVAGQLPEAFSGAGNDIILLGSHQGDIDPLKTLGQFLRAPGIPPVIFFSSTEDDLAKARKLGASGFLLRDKVPHNEFMATLSDILRDQQRIASTDSLFTGDVGTDIKPLVKGFRVIDKLAISEHSAVYLVEKESIGLKLVFKVLRQKPELSDDIGPFDRFLQEYELIAEMEHPNIVKIHDLGVSDNYAHIEMEYLDGGELTHRIEAGIDVSDAVRYTTEIAAALTCIHAVGILHRDLKPANIMLRKDGSVAMIDFGLAKRMRVDIEKPDNGQIFGTPHYMSPEQGHADEVDARSDIYSLGVIFYEMLTGEKPYDASSAMGIIVKHATAPVPVLPDRLSQYQAALNLMLAKKPEDRLQSADELAEWL